MPAVFDVRMSETKFSMAKWYLILNVRFNLSTAIDRYNNSYQKV